MSLQLLQIVNRPDLLLNQPGLTDTDRDLLLALIAGLRRRLDAAVRPLPAAVSRPQQTAGGMWEVRRPRRRIRGGHIADGELLHVFRAVGDPRLPATRGRLIATAVAEIVGSPASLRLPPAPSIEHTDTLTPAAHRLVGSWLREWERLRVGKIRRCEAPRCGIEGGRYFRPRTSERDCPYCRRAASKATRWRRRTHAAMADKLSG